MAQAERFNTAIRELMSLGRPSKSKNPVRPPRTGLIATLAPNVPHLIHSAANCEALEDRADHLQRLFAVLHVDATAETAMHENSRVS
jgi:hypothetical protein